MQTDIETESPQIEYKTPREVLLGWENAYNKRDPYDLIELYAEDAEIVQVAFGDDSIKGRKELLESFIKFFKAFPDNYTNLENLFVDGDWAIIEWNGGGTFTGEMDDAQPTGKSFKLRGCGFFKVIEGKIKFQRGYFDKQTWFGQIGLTGESESETKL